MKSSPDGAAGRFITAILEAQQPSLVGRRARHKQPCVLHGICNWSGFDEIDKVFIDADGSLYFCPRHQAMEDGIELAEQENNQSNSTQRFCDQGR